MSLNTSNQFDCAVVAPCLSFFSSDADPAERMAAPFEGPTTAGVRAVAGMHRPGLSHEQWESEQARLDKFERDCGVKLLDMKGISRVNKAGPAGSDARSKAAIEFLQAADKREGQAGVWAAAQAAMAEGPEGERLSASQVFGRWKTMAKR